MIAAPEAQSLRPLGSEPPDEEPGAGLARGDEDRPALAYRRWGRLVHILAAPTAPSAYWTVSW